MSPAWRSFRLWNAKAQAWAHVQVVPTDGRSTEITKHHVIHVRREGSKFDGWHYDGQARGSIFIYDEDSPLPYLKISASDATHPVSRGWGLTLYLAAALAAKCLGYEGVHSLANSRSDTADVLWNKMRIFGLAKRADLMVPEINTLDADDVRALYRDVPGVTFPC